MGTDGLVTELYGGLDQVVFFNAVSLQEVEMFENSIHFFKVAVIHQDGADAAQEVIKVHVLLLSLVQLVQYTLHNFLIIINTKHPRQLDKVKPTDPGDSMVFLEVGVCLEDIVIEALHIVLVKLDGTVGTHHIGRGGDNTVCARNVGGETAEVAGSLLEILEVLGQELNRVLGPILQ